MKIIGKEQALAAIRNGEFGDDIICSAETVAVILTQNWCPQWRAMKQFAADITGAEVYYLEYDKTDIFDAFREFKEQVLGNDLIPYVRYYFKGTLIAESNAVPEGIFRRNLAKQPDSDRRR
jgi:hypothetical protein